MLDPDLGWPRTVLALTYARSGSIDAAIEELRRVSSAAARDAETIAASGVVYAVGGKRAGALKAVERLQSAATTRYVPPYLIASIHAALGDTAEARAWIEKARAEHSPYILRLAIDPAFERIRGL